MSLTPSSMMPLRTKAPDFRLPDPVSGKTRSLSELKSGQGTVVMFICNHCPYVKHVNPELVRLARDYQPKGVAFVAICANDAKSHPEDAPEKMKETAQRLGYPFPYLYDESQDVARAYQAACTPDFFLFDGTLQLVYRGCLDGSTPGNNIPVTGSSLRTAIEAVLAGKSVDPEQRPSMGCNIKWKK